jgi:hypothetical protein
MVFSAFFLGHHVAQEVGDAEDAEASEQTWELIREVAEGKLTFVAPVHIDPPPGMTTEMEDDFYDWSSDMRVRERKVARILLDIHKKASDV